MTGRRNPKRPEDDGRAGWVEYAIGAAVGLVLGVIGISALTEFLGLWP